MGWLLQLWRSRHDRFSPCSINKYGLRAAVSNVPIAQWLTVIQEVTLQNPNLDDALRDRLVRGIAELNAIAECLD